MGAPNEVLELVRRFREQYDSYRAATYNETQVRREFVDPFFKALGWDIDNAQGHAEAYKEVIHEDSIKIGGATKAPDYSFRIGGQRKFFVETKKPAVNIHQDPSAAYQLRRYAWSAKLPLSILTDFEELAVYDCRIRPQENDKASTARTLYFKFEEYEERWEELADIFAPESIRKGSFDKYAESTKKKRGTAEVDAAFLEDIEEWRKELARNLAVRNTELDQRELNTAVQKTIDRIIFLRICEDRGIEVYGKLQELLNGKKIYPRLCQLFRQADLRYNSGLFHFTKEKDRSEPADEWTLDLQVDDRVLKTILGQLYYPVSPYEFSVLGADILGQVYEQFLGKVIRLTKGHQAKVEDKPEVKKAGGVYYTPTYIVDYIVEQTVGKLVEDKAPYEVAGRTKTTWKPAKRARPLSVLDPACGSGSFLIGAYQYLLDWYRDRYIENGPTKVKDRLYQTRQNEWRLTTAERKRILLDHIYGVDIDPQAVEVTKLSLLLKVLEGENKETLDRQLFAKQRALPDLSENIKCGNSLIGPDFFQRGKLTLFSQEERFRINAFDWNSEFPETLQIGGFDVVLGNPPYDVLEKDRGKSSWPHEALSEYVRESTRYDEALGGKLNLFRFFLVRSLSLLRVGGRFGNIMPLAILADISCAKSRRFLLSSADEIVCSCFPQKDNPSKRVFERAKLSTAVIVCQRQESVAAEYAQLTVRVYPWNSFNDVFKQSEIRLRDTELLDPKNTPIPLVDAENWKLCQKIHRNKKVTRLGEVGEYCIRRGEINQTVYREYISSNSHHSRLLKGVEVGRFELREKLSQGKREWFDEARFLKGRTKKAVVDQSRIATQRITGVDERLRIVASLIQPRMYFADSTNSISLLEENGHGLKYLLGLLNCKLYQWRFKLTSTNNNVGTNELESMPFREVDKNDSESHRIYCEVVQRVDALVDLLKERGKSKSSHAEKVISRQITATDREIDQLVYELYGLNDEEIQVVEEATPG